MDGWSRILMASWLGAEGQQFTRIAREKKGSSLRIAKVIAQSTAGTVVAKARFGALHGESTRRA